MSRGDKQKTKLQSGDDSSRPLADIQSHAVGGNTAEDALRKSEARYRDLVENASVWIWETDRNLRHVYSNHFVTACLGYQPDEFLAADIFSLVHPEDHEDLKEAVRRATTQRKGWTGLVLRWRHKDGSWRHIESSGTASFDSNGNLLGLRGVDQDITERKKAEEEASERTAMLQQILDASSVAIFLVDKLGYITHANQRMAEMFGCTIDDCIGSEYIAHVHPLEREIGRQKMLSLLASEIPSVDLERLYQRKDGTEFWGHLTGRRFYDVQGNELGLVGVISDITKRKQADGALRESEARFRSLAETINEVFWLGSSDWSRIFYISPSYELVWGRQCDELYHDSLLWLESVLEEDRKAVLNALPPPGFTWRGELRFPDYRIVRPDGTARWISARAYPIRDDEGVVSCVAGIAEDITDRKKAEEALRESQAKLDLALRSARMGVWHLDLINNRRTFDDQTCLLLGIDPATFTGSAEEFFGAVHPDDRGSIRVALAQTIEQDTLYEPEYRTIWPDGSIHYITARGRLVRDDKGLPVGINGIIWDVTERKKSEELLRASERKFSAIFSLTPDPTAITDIETGKIIDLNGAFEQLIGRSREELIGMTTADLHVWADLSYRDRMLREIRNSGEITDMAVRLRRYDGKIRETLFSARVIELSGKRYLLSRAHDITEVKRAEEEKRELERQLMQAHRIESLGGLAGGIAHDFNNLLQGIFGYISMAKITIDQRERALSMLDEAEKALHQSVNLSTQLLTFSKGGKPVRKKLALGPAIENTVKFALSGSRVDYKMDVDAGLWMVEADEGQIGQVIQNLVINADQAMPMGGRIVITADNVQAPGENIPGILPRGSYIRISVQDSGIGIPAQYLERIFDPYFTTKEKGSGLGLAISYSIVRNHGGTIHVSSEVGKGSTISVYLPATADTHLAAPAPEKVRGQTRKGKILIMDDEAMVRDVARAMITTLRHEVACAEHGEEAVMMYLQARQQGAPFDIVILDLTIRGGMGGEETIKKLLQIDPEVKAVVSSGYADDSVIADYQSYGFCATLNKPYTMKALSNTLEALLAS